MHFPTATVMFDVFNESEKKAYTNRKRQGTTWNENTFFCLLSSNYKENNTL